MYTLYMDNDLIDEYDSAEALQKEIDSLRNDYAIDEEQDMNKWPSDFDPGYVAGDSFNDYFYDVYCIEMVIDPSQFLKGK